MSTRSKDLPGSLANLKISTSTQAPSTTKPRKAPVADSWDDSDDDQDPTTPTTPTQASQPSVPPPTPASPYLDRDETARSRSAQLPTFSFQQQQFGGNPGLAFSGGSDGASTRRSGPARDGDRRPEKSAAAAGRLIAGALGVRAPKMTSEQREYERVVRDKERSRRNEEKDRVKEEEKGRLAAWED